MFNSIFAKKVPQVLGLDIGASHVKAVLLDKSDKGCSVLAYACEGIVGQAMVDREIKDFDAISNAIRKIKMAMKIKSKDVAVAVSGANVLSKLVYMEPNLTDLDLETQIEIEADSLIPYPLEEVYIDFESLGPSEAAPDKEDVLLSAAHRDLVDNRVTLLREVQLEPKIVDIEGYALGTALLTFIDDEQPESDRSEEYKPEPHCCVQVGHTQLLLTVVQGDRVIYTKEHNFGLEALLQDLALIHAMDRQEAQQQMISGELPATWIEDVLAPFISNLAQQISRALQMYISTSRQAQPENLWITGGGALLPNIAEELSKELSMTTRIFNPLAELPMADGVNGDELQRIGAQLTLAAGLAARGFSSWHI